MGCCSSKSTNSKASRLSRWQSTGIVALRDSKLKTFPYEVLDLGRSVRTLDLTHNRLVDIPQDIGKLINLQRLIFADNLVVDVPGYLGKLKNLKVATFDSNKITSLPDELGQLVKLEQLSVSANLLVCLPETLGSLRNLVLLNVSNNKLESLPESIGSCFSLEELKANDNSITELPGSICSLVHLKSLCLDNNKLRQLPLLSLNYLWGSCAHPPACELPAARSGFGVMMSSCEAIPPNLLTDCKSLQNISLHENPISMDQFQQVDGFQDFETRRKKKFDKQIDSNVMISSKGLDEGVDL